jgi:hypothetical protein
MTEVTTNLKHIDKQLASLLDIVNTVGNNLYSFISLKKIKIEEGDCILAYIFQAVMNL